MKDKLRKIAYFCLVNNVIVGIVAFVIFVILLAAVKFFNRNTQIVDFTIFFAVFMAIILEIVATLLAKLIRTKLEDFVKLELNYEKLVNQYSTSGKFMSYANEECSKEEEKIGEKTLKKLGREIKKNEQGFSVFNFPVIVDSYLKNNELEIVDSLKQYQLPEDIKEHFDEIFSAHADSNVYNQLNIRVDKWYLEKNVFTMETSRTTYYDSLVTNRAMDFKWDNGMTNRDLFLYGPFVQELAESQFSNHLGFNGFVISSDGYIPFVKRSDNVSIGKRTYGDSIGASLKAKYCVDKDSKQFTLEGLENGIFQEVEDELKISSENIEGFSFSNNLIAAYRDMVEGGKPQLLFWMKAKLTKEEIADRFDKEIKEKTKRKKWDKEYAELEDGKKLLWIKVDELDKLYITPELIVHKGKTYPMMPSASAAIVMLIKYFKSN